MKIHTTYDPSAEVPQHDADRPEPTAAVPEPAFTEAEKTIFEHHSNPQRMSVSDLTDIDDL